VIHSVAKCYSNPIDDDIIYRLAYGGAKLEEVADIMREIYSLKHIAISEDELLTHIHGVMEKNKPHVVPLSEPLKSQ